MKTKRSLYNLFFNLVSQIVTFAVGIILPRLFLVSQGSEVNGLVSSVGQVFAYVGLLEAGLGATVIQVLYKPIVDGDYGRINRILSASGKSYKKIGSIYIACIFSVAIGYPLIVKTDIPTWQIVGVVFFSGIGNAINFLLQQNYVVLLAAEGKGYVTTNLNLAVHILTSIIKAVLLLRGYNVVYVQGAQFVVSLLRIIIMRMYITHNYKWLNTHEDPDWTALSKQKYVLIQQVSYFIYSNTDISVLTLFGNLTTVSVYVIYNMIFGVIEGIVGAFTSSVIFALGQLYNEDFEKFKKVFVQYDAFYMTLVFALFTIAYLCILPFLSVYTRGVNDANYMDQILALLFVILKMVATLRSQSQNTINFAGAFEETKNSAIIEAVLNVIISLVGVYYIGIYGVVIGSIISTGYRGIYVTYYANKNILKLGHSAMVKKYIRWVTYICVFILLCAALQKYIPSTVGGYVQWGKIAVGCTVLSTVCYGAAWYFADVELARQLIKILKARSTKNRNEENP